MKLPVPPEDEIAAAVVGALLPHPFAPRRELEVAGAVNRDAASTSWFDAFWPADGRLAFAAARVRRGGLGGALRAAWLQRLVRGLLALDADPEAAVPAACDLYGREFAGGEVDLLLGTLDTRSGRLARAGRGRVLALGPEHVGGPGAARDAAVWLVAGGGALDPAALPGLDADLGPAARGVADLSGPGSAAVGLVVRAGRRPPPGRAFSMSNDLAAVARLTGRIEAALDEGGVPGEVGAAFALALDELLTNVVLYGFADGGRHEILVDLAVGAEEVEVRLSDDGRAFDPLSFPEPDLGADIDARAVGGLCIHFARTLLDGIDYGREKGWNVLRLRKRFSRESGASSPGG